MTRGRFGKLLEPGHIGKVKTKNRMIKTASTLGYRYDEKDGHITPRQLSILKEVLYLING